MHKKLLIGIVGAATLLSLFGCGSNSDGTIVRAEQNPSVNSPTSNMPITTPAPTPIASSINEERNEAIEESVPENFDLPAMTDDERRIRGIFEIPEGFILNTPPTQVHVGLADGAYAPLVVMGERLTFDGQGPVMLGGEVFVPVFGVFDGVNPVFPFVTSWEGDIVTIRNPHVTITITEVTGGDATFEHILTPSFSGFRPVVPSLPAQRINGEFMLPLRPIAEAIGVEFEWVEERGEVHLFIIVDGISMGFQDEDGVIVSMRAPNPFIE
ncbi:MAG: copper amine oxidase N-terminal domain-containing protein [Defluviitaleaceae bacterium]|nr:copper amine oxidase N-terminal domain-containing protein [Defluviitaleaceae bacterium]